MVTVDDSMKFYKGVDMTVSVAGIKKRLSNFSKRFNAEMGDFNHLYHVDHLLDQVEEDLSYIEEKLEMRKVKVLAQQEEEIKAAGMKAKAKKNPVGEVQRVETE